MYISKAHVMGLTSEHQPQSIVRSVSYLLNTEYKVKPLVFPRMNHNVPIEQ